MISGGVSNSPAPLAHTHTRIFGRIRMFAKCLKKSYCVVYIMWCARPRHLILDLILTHLSKRNHDHSMPMGSIPARSISLVVIFSTHPRSLPQRNQRRNKEERWTLGVERVCVWVCSDNTTRGNQADITACERKFGPEGIRDG